LPRPASRIAVTIPAAVHSRVLGWLTEPIWLTQPIWLTHPIWLIHRISLRAVDTPRQTCRSPQMAIC
jgi:hypothetical protein